MSRTPAQYSLAGDEKARYLRSLNNSIKALVRDVATRPGSEQQRAALREFGEQQRWNWKRLPAQSLSQESLAKLLVRVGAEYQWFDTHLDEQDSTKNYGYFETLDISAESGLPWLFEFIKLRLAKDQAATHLQSLPTSSQLFSQYRSLLLEDHIEISHVSDDIKGLHSQALQRGFFEQVQNADLLRWETTGINVPLKASQIHSLGGEEFWNLLNVSYNPASSMFHIYVMDVWQDIRDPVIKETKPGIGAVSPALERSCTSSFNENNAGWYILQTIDEKFKSLHPVHVSRGLLGPFETKYLTKAKDIVPLEITGELLKENENTTLLRFSHQYTYAPNHEVVDGELRQIVHRQDWRDEYVVAPAKYAARVAHSVLGTSVRVVQM